MPKINFIIHFFLEILHLKESCNLTGWQHFCSQLENQIFARYGTVGEISTTILVSILDYFREKLKTKFSKKSKKPYFGAILDPFCPNLRKIEFSWKKGLCQFLDIPIIYHHAKNQKKLLSHFWEKCQTDGRTDGWTNRQTDRQWWFYRTLRRTGVQKCF